MDLTDVTRELDSCDYLFLNAIEERGPDGLRLVVDVGKESPEATEIAIAGTIISGLHHVSAGESSLQYEIDFATYIAYAVRNESYVLRDEEQVWAGKSFRVYSKSKFLDFVRSATFATTEYPGPFAHYSLVCQDRVVDVASIAQPKVKRLR